MTAPTYAERIGCCGAASAWWQHLGWWCSHRVPLGGMGGDGAGDRHGHHSGRGGGLQYVQSGGMVEMYVSLQPASNGCQGMGCSGMGDDAGGLFGTGLFASGLDLTQWGAGEIVGALFGLFVLYSVFSTTSRGVSRVRGKVRKIGKAGENRRKKQAEKLREEARK